MIDVLWLWAGMTLYLVRLSDPKGGRALVRNLGVDRSETRLQQVQDMYRRRPSRLGVECTTIGGTENNSSIKS